LPVKRPALFSAQKKAPIFPHKKMRKSSFFAFKNFLVLARILFYRVQLLSAASEQPIIF
jgi:hypothetical protein